MISRDTFTNQQAFIVTANDLTRPWGGHRDGSRFRCALCGHRFTEGDTARWVFTNGTPGAGGNPFVCSDCDGTNEEVIAKWRQHIADFRASKDKFWSFYPCACRECR